MALKFLIEAIVRRRDIAAARRDICTIVSHTWTMFNQTRKGLAEVCTRLGLDIQPGSMLGTIGVSLRGGRITDYSYINIKSL